jgi:UDP-3-O-[3-hydroxymyristoyl] glucosamine N-acyltransferase
VKRATKRRSGSNGHGASPKPGGRFFTLAEVAEAVGGRVVGDPSFRLEGVASLEGAAASDLSWVADSRRIREAIASAAGALLVGSEEAAGGRPAVVVGNPLAAFAHWLGRVRPPKRPRPGVSREARVARTARIGKGASIGPAAVIAAGASIGARAVVESGAYVGEGAQIGDDTWIHPNASVLEGCRVGQRCVIHSGAVVGSDGFGYVWDGAAHRKIPQVGIVRIEDDVEIGANSTIDRATLGETVIGRGTKIDNLVQIGHNVVIGEHVIVCGQAGIAGSSRIGSRATLAGQAGVGDHVTVGDAATLTGQSGVVSGSRVAPGAVVSGMPAVAHREFLKAAALVARLPLILRRIEMLEKAAGGRGKGA